MERERFGLRSVEGPRLPSGLPVGVFFDTGVSDREPGKHVFGGLPGFLDPTRWNVFFEDFHKYSASDWVVTETQAAHTQTIASEDGGVLTISTTAGTPASGDTVNMQWAGGAGAFVGNFRMNGDKPFLFSARWKISNATQAGAFIGLAVADTSLIASEPTDGVYFIKPTGSADLSVKAAKSSAAVSANAIHTLVSDTYFTSELAYDGISRLWYGINGVVKGFITPGASWPNTADLGVSFAVINGDANARTMSIDWILAGAYRS